MAGRQYSVVYVLLACFLVSGVLSLDLERHKRYQSKVNIDELEAELKGLEEEMDCGSEPALTTHASVWSFAAHRFCKMSKDLTTSKAFESGLLAGLKIVLYSTGIGQAGNFFQSIGSCFGALGCAIVGETKKAREFGLDAADQLRGVVDPTVAVAEIMKDTSAAAAASVWACTVSIITAYTAFSRAGLARHYYFQLGIPYGSSCASSFPSGCGMPKMSNNPFLKMITEDSGCPAALVNKIKEDKPMHWHELTKAVSDAAASNVGIVLVLATRMYSRTVRTLHDVLSYKFFSLVCKEEDILKYTVTYYSNTAYTGPMPASAPAAVVSGTVADSGLK